MGSIVITTIAISEIMLGEGSANQSRFVNLARTSSAEPEARNQNGAAIIKERTAP